MKNVLSVELQICKLSYKKKRIASAITLIFMMTYLTCKATTINRDENVARNIALIGFSKMASKDGETLPLFRSSYNLQK